MINSFLLIGQSNMAGRGSLHEVESIENKDILMFRDNKWIMAKEPLHTDKPNLAGIGLGMSFAETLQIKFDKKIGLIPCAYGGTSLSEWEKGGKLYANACSVTMEALKNSTLKGILWHQGESDSDNLLTAQSYKEKFLFFIDSLLTDIGISISPIIVGELGDFLDQFSECTYSHIVNKHLEDLCNGQDLFEYVSSKGLTHNGDFLHFNAASLREFGKCYATAWEESSQKLGITLE
jgi:Carbohydrate esterase, sialic acid-specific acetylesterase